MCGGPSRTKLSSRPQFMKINGKVSREGEFAIPSATWGRRVHQSNITWCDTREMCVLKYDCYVSDVWSLLQTKACLRIV